MPKEYTSKPVEKCQICGASGLRSVLFIGYIPPVNTMPTIGSTPVEETVYPLEMLRCEKCTLVQIGLEVDQNILFPLTYPYLSASTKILRENFANLCRESSSLLGLKAGDLVADIGSNDGTLLSNFKNAGYRVLGIEPTNAADIANANDITSEKVFFNAKNAAAAKKKYGEAKVITAANVFAHIGDIHPIVDEILDLLAPNGVFISESHYLLGLIETVQYDTIYHEHLRYYSMRSLSYLLNMHGLEVFHVTRIPTHGGSIRVYAARKGQKQADNSVSEILAEEDRKGITDGSALAAFRKKVIQSKLALHELLRPLKEAGARIYGIGAPSRSSTLINYVGLDDGLIDCVMEIKTSPKVGKYVPGTRIPVLDEEKLYADQPEYALLFSWHITNELTANLRKKGFKGKFIVPLPWPSILEI
ncbi:class I SAM-dependent methyltransferase [Candidatus Peregrinibacteria bacterium]|nr:class I SAM-dependent methyltransferase [Candidatus Peregrinibacteria bacterium]